MNDLTFLLSLVLVFSATLYFLRFNLWWVLLVIGISFYLILSYLIGENLSILNDEGLQNTIKMYLDRNMRLT